MTRFRWVILALIFLGTTFNYIERLAMGLLASDLQKTFSISDVQYGYIGFAFGAAYAIGQFLSGGVLDRIGTRLGYALALASWGIAGMCTALGRGAMSFAVLRSLLGFTQSPAYPAAAKVCAEWFPRRQRAFAFSFVNVGANFAAIVAPILVPWLALTLGWQGAFIVTGAASFLVLLLWVPLYHKPELHPRVSRAELALIHSDPPELSQGPVPSTISLIRHRQAWAFALGKFLTDAMWWFHVTWLPKFLGERYGLSLLQIGLPLVMIHLIAMTGSVGGGWLSSAMIHRGIAAGRARKTALLIAALCVVPIIFAQNINAVWVAVAILGLATAGHQAFNTTLYSLCSDLFPKRAVASVAGFGGTVGWIGAALFQLFTGYWVQRTGNYHGPFLCAGTAYLVAVGLVQLLSPRYTPADLKVRASAIANRATHPNDNDEAAG